MTQSTPKTAVIYARVSTRRQAADGLPLESQVERCRQRARSLGATSAKEFIDAGISGRIDERPGFQAALAYCEQHRPDYFITWSTSRFARNKLDAAVNKQRLAVCGTRLVYVSMDLDRDTDGGWMTESVLEVLDEFLSRQVSADTRRSMLRNASSGYWNGGTPPLGYRSVVAEDDPRRRRLVVVPVEAEIVRRIVTMRLSGMGVRSIAETLNMGEASNRGRRWNKTSVSALLRNDALRGVQAYGKRDHTTGRRRPREDWMEARSHEPIIDPATWELLQGVMDDATNTRDSGSPLSTWMFTGMLRCGRCGASMQIETAKGRRRRYSYYNCRTWQRTGGCRCRRLPAELVDETLLTAVLERLFTTETLTAVLEQMNAACGAWSAQQQARQARLSGEIAALQRRQDNLTDTVEQLGGAGEDVQVLVRRLVANEAQLDALRNQMALASLEPPPALTISADDLDDMRDFLVAAVRSPHSPARTRNFLATLLERIIVEDEQARLVYWPEVLLSGTTGSRQMRRFPAAAVWRPGRALLGTVTASIRWPRRLRYGWRDCRDGKSNLTG